MEAPTVGQPREDLEPEELHHAVLEVDLHGVADVLEPIVVHHQLHVRLFVQRILHEPQRVDDPRQLLECLLRPHLLDQPVGLLLLRQQRPPPPLLLLSPPRRLLLLPSLRMLGALRAAAGRRNGGSAPTHYQAGRSLLKKSAEDVLPIETS